MEEALLTAALVLAAIHFGVPLTYYWYAKNKWLSRPWNIKVDESYEPCVTIIVPTYNEAKHIEDKLRNIYEQSYPKELIEVLVVDGASSDGTPELVERWAMKYPDLNVILIREKERRGKAMALNEALKLATGEVIIIADADAIWESNALHNAIKYLADPQVGAVSCIKYPQKSGPAGVERGYRNHYNLLRIAESKAYSTPLFHGELAAFKRELLKKVGGFPTDVGADDSLTATKIAVMGFRTIVAEDVVVLEKIPDLGYGMWRIRRAQHLIQHFI
ncbi:MAG: glycosyltransferase family 2 protein, partial [Candidatus Nezhaarchaeota archaeon]|nr:glycosyltransferase family 2 protein [Candidatus Nezhaarchaeota archaeon]